MKLKSIIACTAVLAVAIGTDHGATAAGSYTITQLDANSGLPRGGAFSISDNGVVGGESDTSGGERHAVMWTAAGDPVDLGTAGSESRARFVSENGVIVGETRTETGALLFAVTPSGRIEIGTLGQDIFPVQMNRHGSVIGSYIRDDDTFGAFFWSIATGLVDIPVDAPEVSVTALSENDIVAGFGQTETASFGFVWTPAGGLVNIPSLGGDRTFPNAVNSSGLVGGFSSTSKGRDHAFAWAEAGGIIDLGTLQGGSESFAQIVTENGTIIGTSDAKSKTQRAAASSCCSCRGARRSPSISDSIRDLPSGA